ncbi:hypothetical protein [Undibacterium pigrum]|uniref:Uncharacterized protein n=1 Tax=Undibacterium pigrum TaxID=401470 RepID=A0A318JAS5_9BURK|nr:hypothetical protein [Undibacterium pigrum]PXX45492.1 hypothetical protein DFR42_102720 [Undibacterium pigrum]
MKLDEFYSNKKDGEISATEAQSLNEELAKISLNDIPLDCRALVADYLTLALNMQSVRKEISPALDSLLSEIQAQG